VDNIWFPGGDPTDKHLCWVRDLTGTYNVDPARLKAQGGGADPAHQRILVGSYTTGGLGGPVCQPGTVWSEAIAQYTAITIQSLAGDPLGQASAETISTYKVIRAVAQVECAGCFDGVNGWDVARVSLGPYNFALFLRGAQAELPAFLSFLATTAPDDFNAAFARYGIDTAEPWPVDAAPIQNKLYDRTARKWVTYLKQRGLEIVPGSRIISLAGNPVVIGNDADYFRNWHWFYRWVMACRVFPNIWRQCWDFCRYRLQALLQAELPATAGLPDHTTLGQVFTSEYAVTALLRAHVNMPTSVIMQRRASDTIANSVANSKPNDPNANDPAQWTNDQHQRVDKALVDALIALAAGKHWPYANDMMTALNYAIPLQPPPAPGTNLIRDAGSFQFRAP
jgi:hypothetical protein